MLDAKELAKRITAAMDLRDPPIPQVELAAKCGVTKQAVYEWRTTGRMGKSHLLTVARETGMPLEFFLESDRGSTPETKRIWARLGKAFAKAAMIALVALGVTLSPRPSYASVFDGARLLTVYYVKLILSYLFLTSFRIRTCELHVVVCPT